jgi:hypothetical protein
MVLPFWQIASYISLVIKMKKCLSFYFVYHEDELGLSFAFISAQIVKGHGGIIKTYACFLHRRVTLL